MGYISSDVELDAILTKKGRELLTTNPELFNITKFALSDDEIDYRLWNTDHSLGSNYYGEVIENTPVTEPIPVENQMVKFRLITLPKDSQYIPKVSIASNDIEIRAQEQYVIVPNTFPAGNDTSGYTAILSNTKLATLIPELVTPGPKPLLIPSDDSTYTQIGLSFRMTGKTILDATDRYGTVTIIGNDTGGRVVLKFKLIRYYAESLY